MAGQFASGMVTVDDQSYVNSLAERLRYVRWDGFGHITIEFSPVIDQKITFVYHTIGRVKDES